MAEHQLTTHHADVAGQGGGVGRLAVVSGGGSGIGKAIATELARGGCRVVILGRRAEALELARKEIGAAVGEGRVIPLVVDLTDPEATARAASAIAAYGPVDVLVNNAGARVTAPVDGSLAALAASWRSGLEANLLSAVLLTSALLGQLRRPGARLIVVSSTAAQRGGAGPHSAGAYAAAKAALHGWAFGLARELGPDGITVNLVAPGYIAETEIFGEGWTEEFHAAKVAETLVGRAGVPADVAGVIGYLASPGAGYLTGQVIGVNGGVVLGR
ncbi:short-chain dehydrogenase [Kitasatospora sp. MMS16-BH015]|uniref:SDR family NAD(P)-dependent oxidoreductase n=1 Tax=Kitasatospora sp. MMS16-BH015 TaxID=2018025 RepID=UPI000CA2845E|nr:SDR family oxidoreductase [Kitasatospora sp. MMS16-BH015]AUG78352.1 short-chain dehydrogenase [Kitasatospora sp. MMS16-BH015]